MMTRAAVAAELAESLKTWGADNPLLADISVGRKWALCGIVADWFARHSPGFDRTAFMQECGF